MQGSSDCTLTGQGRVGGSICDRPVGAPLSTLEDLALGQVSTTLEEREPHPVYRERPQVQRGSVHGQRSHSAGRWSQAASAQTPTGPESQSLRGQQAWPRRG